MKGLTFWLLYFTPALIGWFRTRQGKRQIYSPGQLFLFNLLLGWTVVGWFLLLANALGFNPVAAIAPRLAKVVPQGWYDPPQGQNGVAQLRTCTACASSGRLRCSSCNGSGRAAALI